MSEVKKLEKILKTLANNRRLAIIYYLKKRKNAKVGDIANAINLSFTSTSKHLMRLFNADILEKEQKNLEMWYKLAPDQNKIVDFIISNSRE
jgi:DNA-binding transcriptional ArsR family regulator